MEASWATTRTKPQHQQLRHREPRWAEQMTQFVLKSSLWSLKTHRQTISYIKKKLVYSGVLYKKFYSIVLLKNILDKKLKEGEPTTGLTFSLVFGDARWQCQVGTLSRPITLSHCCHGTDGTAPSATRPVHALRDLRVTSRWNRVPLVFIIIGVHMSCGTDTWELQTIGSPFSCSCNIAKYTAEITINSTK